MEEGKRMFSIFAARMFEQRVLQAYREKVRTFYIPSCHSLFLFRYFVHCYIVEMQMMIIDVESGREISVSFHHCGMFYLWLWRRIRC